VRRRVYNWRDSRQVELSNLLDISVCHKDVLSPCNH
jgi:hypothetical protein